MKGRTVGIACGLLALVAGCSDIWKSIEPDRYRAGVSVRRVEGSFNYPLKNFKKFKVREDIMVGTIQGNKRINEHLDSYISFSGNVGSVEATPLDVRAWGQIEYGGIGLSYYPFRKDGTSNKLDFSLDFGAEGGYADFDMVGKVGPIYSSVHDNIWFWGGKVGATAECKLNDNTSFIFSGGYSFTDNETHHAKADFDGAYFFVGFELKLP